MAKSKFVPPKMQRRSYLVTDISDIEKLALHHYPQLKGLNLLRNEHCHNDSWDVIDTKEDEAWGVGEDEFSAKSSTSRVLIQLCRDGHLKHGKYLIRVCW